MEYHFSDNAAAIKPSAIREILKLSSAPGIVPFSAGNPSPEAFPEKEVLEITSRLLREDPIAALQYSVTEGYQPLREYLLSYLKSKYGIGTAQDRLIVTAGAQQVMSLASLALCQPGDVILCEAPSFVGSVNALKLTGARLRGIPMEADGMDLNALEDALKQEKNVRLLYIIPNFQNPTGICTSAQKRRAIYDLAVKYDILILEDNPYGDLYYREVPPAAIKTLDTDGRVLYAGSFSKVLSPGLRVGFALGGEALIAKMTALKQTQDVHTNILAQLVAYHYMTEYDFEAHLEDLRRLYTSRAAEFTRLAEQYLLPRITFAPITGGLFLWCTLPEGTDMPAFCKRAVEEYKVAVVPGSAFLIDPAAPCRNFRMNFTTPTVQQMQAGMEALSRMKDTL